MGIIHCLQKCKLIYVLKELMVVSIKIYYLTITEEKWKCLNVSHNWWLSKQYINLGERMLLLNRNNRKGKWKCTLPQDRAGKLITGKDSHRPSLIFKATNHPSSGERTGTGTDWITTASLCRLWSWQSKLAQNTAWLYLLTCRTPYSLCPWCQQKTQGQSHSEGTAGGAHAENMQLATCSSSGVTSMHYFTV